MKKIFVSFILIGCCFILWSPFPLFAQSQSPYLQPPIYYQPYPSPQYTQPGEIPSYWPPQPSPWGSGYYWDSPKHMYQYGLQLVYAKRYNEAIQVFHEFLRYYPQSSLADNALYWTGECYYAMKHYPIALSYFQRIQFDYPQGNKVPDAMLKTALSYISMKQYNRGCRVLDDLIYRYPNSESARKAHRWLDRCGGYPPYWDYDYRYPYYSDTTFPKNY